MSPPELNVTSHFSFLRGASSPEELFATAAMLGHKALAITDHNSVGGAVRAHVASRATGVRAILGCRLELTHRGGAQGASLLVYPQDKTAWSRMCRLISTGRRRTIKGECALGWDDVATWQDGLHAILLPGHAPADARRFAGIFGGRGSLALVRQRSFDDEDLLAATAATAKRLGLATVACGDILYHSVERSRLHDVVSAIRHGCTLDELGQRRQRRAGHELRRPQDMADDFRAYPEALARACEIANACRFSLDELSYNYPDERENAAISSDETLRRLTLEGAAQTYNGAVPEKVAVQLEHELQLIQQQRYTPYFLTVHRIVRFARSRGILCQGRGSAANSAVCYVLGITAIDPIESNLLFARFISTARDEPPDIDVDFEHERREEVIQWIYETYGRDRAALTGVVSRYRTRGALRDVGKVLGLSEDVTASLASQVWGWSTDGIADETAQALNLNTTDPRLKLALELTAQLVGTPRHMSQHPGGFVLTHDRLDDLVPIEPAAMKDRQVIEWDKDDIETLKFMKVDVLGLGMLGCMRRAFDMMGHVHGRPYQLTDIPQDDPPTYAMIQRADTMGVFQIESRAQMSMLPRLRPARLYDLVIQVAIVRPGPIQGDMVHPYLRRRDGTEQPEYPRPELKSVLGKTLGVPLFQEQAMQVAIVCAGFTPDEADELRRAMATFKITGGVNKFKDKMIAGMVVRGYKQTFAERTFKQIEGFGSYGFPESHAASFALLAYASSYLKCHYPDVFLCALLNAQPMGFYAVAQLVRDAVEHGVIVRPVCVVASRWDSTLEPLTTNELAAPWPEDCITARPRFAVRLGLRLAKGFSQQDALVLERDREGLTVTEVLDVVRGRAATEGLEQLAYADAFAGVGAGRRAAAWAITGVDGTTPLFGDDPAAGRVEPAVMLTPMRAGAEVVEDYRASGVSLRPHPVSFLRDDLATKGMRLMRELTDWPAGKAVSVAGLVLVRQKPGSAKGVMFITLEDESGIANLVVWPSLFERQRGLILTASMMAVRGVVQREGQVVHVVARQLTDMTALLRSVGDRDDFVPPTGRGDEARHGGAPDARDGKKAPMLPLRPAGIGGRHPRDIYCPEFDTRTGIAVKTRDFR